MSKRNEKNFNRGKVADPQNIYEGVKIKGEWDTKTNHLYGQLGDFYIKGIFRANR